MEASPIYDLKADRSQNDRWIAGFPLFLVIFGLFAALRFWHLSYYCLDGDEIFSLTAARADWAAMFSAVAADLVHPPFSYVVLKLWILIGGDGIFWLRLLPTLLSMAAVIPFLLLCRDLKISRAATTLALYFAAVNGYIIYWAHDIRMYSLLLCLTLLSYWLFIRFYKAGDCASWAILPLAIVNLLLVYTHYFGWLVIGVQFAFILVFARSGLRVFLAAIAGWTVAFLPWAYAVKLAAAEKDGFAQNLGWIARPGLSAVFWFYEMLNGDVEIPHSTLVGIAVFCVPLLIVVFRDIKTWRSEGPQAIRDRWLLIAAATIPVVAAFGASRILPQSVWGDRHLIVAAVPYFLIVSEAVFHIRHAAVRAVLIAVMLLWSGYAGLLNLTENKRPAWDQVTARMIESEPAGNGQVSLYTYEKVIDPILEFYILKELNESFRVRNVTSVEGMIGDHFWVAVRTPVGGEDTTPQQLESRGYHSGPGFRSETPLETVTVFPVWKR